MEGDSKSGRYGSGGSSSSTISSPQRRRTKSSIRDIAQTLKICYYFMIKVRKEFILATSKNPGQHIVEQKSALLSADAASRKGKRIEYTFSFVSQGEEWGVTKKEYSKFNAAYQYI